MPSGCPPWPASQGREIIVPSGDVARLVAVVNTAEPGDVILLEDGAYPLNGEYIWIDVPGVALRSRSGDRSAVVLDGGYETTEIVTVLASDVTIADLTLRRAFTHGIHVTGGREADVTGTVVYNVDVVDPGEQAIKVNQSGDRYPDFGIIACSHMELTAEGRGAVRNNCYTGGIDAHSARGWRVYDNVIEGFWCAEGLSEHAIHFWRACRDTFVERNLLLNNGRGIGFGLANRAGENGRLYEAAACPDPGGYVDHYGGVIRNNVVIVDDPQVFGSAAGFDTGISLWNACDVDVVHNTVFSTAAPFSSIEWRFDSTSARLVNNLVSHRMMERTPGTGTVRGNLEGAGAEFFVRAPRDLHLAPGSPAIDAGEALAADLCPEDFEGRLRDPSPDVGAYESR